MAKRDAKKAKLIARKPAPKTDSKDTVTVVEQLAVIKAATDEKVLDAIQEGDKRPGVFLAIAARRNELKPEQPTREDKFPTEKLAEIESELLAPVGEPNMGQRRTTTGTTPPPTAPTFRADEAKAERVAEKPAPLTALGGGVLGSISAEAEDKQEIGSQIAQDIRAIEELAKLKNVKVAAAQARLNADQVMKEAKRLAEVATAAEAKAARAETATKPAPAPKVEEDAEGKSPPEEAKGAGSAIPSALL